MLEDLKKAIIDYCNREFEEENKYEDFDKIYPDLSDIGLAYTETPDGKHSIQFTLNIEDKSWTQYVDKKVIETQSFSDMPKEEAIKNLLDCINLGDFDEFVSVDRKKLRKALGYGINGEGNFYPLKKYYSER